MYRNYLVTGATGFLGRVIVEKLIEQDMQVRVLALQEDLATAALPHGVEVVYGDVCDAESLLPFFWGVGADTCVIHCAGVVSVASNPGKVLYDVNVRGTENILHLCAMYDVGKLVYVSSVHAIPARPKGVVITERAIFSPDAVRGDYAKSKTMATEQVFAAARRGLNASVVFPSGIIGPGSSQNSSIMRMLLSFLAGKLPFAVKGGYDFVDVRDVADGILGCAAHGLPGHGYILSGHFATIRDILTIAKATIKQTRMTMYLPIGFARHVAPLYERYCLRRKKPLFFTPYAVEVLDSNGAFSHQEATKAFGYTPRPICDTLKDTVSWLQRKET